MHSNYEIDLFQRLIKVAAKLTNTADLENKSLRVIADHIRACSFLIVDGVLPSNEGRGYVLRRLLRRAARHGKLLGLERPFLHEVVGAVVDGMTSILALYHGAFVAGLAWFDAHRLPTIWLAAPLWVTLEGTETRIALFRCTQMVLWPK